MANPDDAKSENDEVSCSSTADPIDEPFDTACSSTADPIGEPFDTAGETLPGDSVSLNVVYKKQKFKINVHLDTTIATLKKQIHSVIDVPPAMQKVMIRGLAPDQSTLRQLSVISGAKVMVVGSTLSDVLSVAKPEAKALKEELQIAEAAKEKLCEMKVHKKILDKGIPEDVMPCRLNTHEPLPPTPLSGMLSRTGGKVRLTFKMEADQLWIGTKERTEKLAMSSIKAVVSEPITGHEGYHVMGIQLGPTEASRYWIYWVPAQYVNAVKDAVLGKWQYF